MSARSSSTLLPESVIWRLMERNLVRGILGGDETEEVAQRQSGWSQLKHMHTSVLQPQAAFTTGPPEELQH